MVDFTPPTGFTPEPNPAPLPTTVSMNPPMVGEVSPFHRVDGQNRDLILESIRTWTRTELLAWAKSWQDYLGEYSSGLGDWINDYVISFQDYLELSNAELRAEVEAVLQQVISNSIELQDAVMAGIGADPDSTTRVVFDALYVRPRSSDGNATAPLTYVNVDDHGAIGDGVADDTAAIQAAIDSAGSGGVTRLSPGKVYNVTGTLTIPLWGTLEGVSNSIGAGPTSPAEIKFTGPAADGIQAGQYATLKHLKLRGRGAAVGLARGINGASVTLEDISTVGWYTGVYLSNAYYAHMYRCEFSRNSEAVTLAGCYNVNVYSCRIYGWNAPNTYGIGFNGGARALNIFGGSIESVRTGVNLQSKQAVNMYAVYFEQKAPVDETWPTITSYVVGARDRFDASVNMHGCFIYMNHLTAIVTTINSTTALLVAKANHLVYALEETAAVIGYQVSQNQTLDIGPDNLAEMLSPNANYVAASGGLPVVGGVVTLKDGVVYDGRRRVGAVSRQSATGTATLDTAKYERFVVTLTGVTAIALSADAGRDRIIISILPGGFAYTFPANFRFAGGAAPSTATAGTMTTVEMQLDTPTGRWHEVSRSVAVTY